MTEREIEGGRENEKTAQNKTRTCTINSENKAHKKICLCSNKRCTLGWLFAVVEWRTTHEHRIIAENRIVMAILALLLTYIYFIMPFISMRVRVSIHCNFANKQTKWRALALTLKIKWILLVHRWVDCWIFELSRCVYRSPIITSPAQNIIMGGWGNGKNHIHIYRLTIYGAIRVIVDG